MILGGNQDDSGSEVDEDVVSKDDGDAEEVEVSPVQAKIIDRKQ